MLPYLWRPPTRYRARMHFDCVSIVLFLFTVSSFSFYDGLAAQRSLELFWSSVCGLHIYIQTDGLVPYPLGNPSQVGELFSSCFPLLRFWPCKKWRKAYRYRYVRTQELTIQLLVMFTVDFDTVPLSLNAISYYCVQLLRESLTYLSARSIKDLLYIFFKYVFVHTQNRLINSYHSS